MPASIERIAFTCTIYDAENRRQNFGQVSNAFIRIVDQSTGTELIRYDLAEDFSIETAIVWVSCTATTASGNSMPSAAASRAVWQPCAATTALTLSDYKEEYHAYQLQKGQKVSLTKGNPGLTKVVVGLGWDVNSFDTGGDFDLDAAAFLLGESGKVTSSGDFVFYGNLKHSSGAVEHLAIT